MENKPLSFLYPNRNQKHENGTLTIDRGRIWVGGGWERGKLTFLGAPHNQTHTLFPCGCTSDSWQRHNCVKCMQSCQASCVVDKNARLKPRPRARVTHGLTTACHQCLCLPDRNLGPTCGLGPALRRDHTWSHNHFSLKINKKKIGNKELPDAEKHKGSFTFMGKGGKHSRHFFAHLYTSCTS